MPQYEATVLGDGLRRLLYGLRKVCGWIVETEGKGVVMKPPPYFTTCSLCSILTLVCYARDKPCPGTREKCNLEVDCGECAKMSKCIYENKPCCWDCGHLIECLENERNDDAERYVEKKFKSGWIEFIEAVRMLKENV